MCKCFSLALYLCISRNSLSWFLCMNTEWQKCLQKMFTHSIVYVLVSNWWFCRGKKHLNVIYVSIFVAMGNTLVKRCLFYVKILFVFENISVSYHLLPYLSAVYIYSGWNLLICFYKAFLHQGIICFKGIYLFLKAVFLF